MYALHLKLKRAIRKKDENAIVQILLLMRYKKMQCKSVCTGKSHRLNRSNMESKGQNRYNKWSGPRQSNTLKGKNGNR